ncbi:MAG: DNRLRE domain-containing protein [Opitutaceae bacterium]|nr:DNRLRE domain-containing protein [Opitutaceae bacterium]
MIRLISILLTLGPLLALADDAPAWRSMLYPDNWSPAVAEAARFDSDKLIQDFSYAGYRSGAAALPRPATPLVDVTQSPYLADATGQIDATAAIQSAINTVGLQGGGVVYLPEGTYRLSVPASANEALLITRSGVILRGAGRGRTFLLNTTFTGMRFKSVIRVRGPSDARPLAEGSHRIAISADLLRPTRVIPVADVSPFSAGDLVVLRADLTDAWAQEHSFPDWIGHGAALGGLAYLREIVAVDLPTSSLVVDIPIRYALKTRDNARVHRLSARPISEVGLEDFSIGETQHPGQEWGNLDYDDPTKPAYDVASAFTIMIERARDVWVRRVSSFQPAANTSTAHVLSGGVSVRDSTRATIDDCKFQRPQYGGGGGNGYMFRLINASECLVARSEARWSRHGLMVTGMQASGNVFHACLDALTGRSTGATGTQLVNGRASDHHGNFSQSNLIDVCSADRSWWEAKYRDTGAVPSPGLTAAHSVFWNTEGIDAGTDPVVISEQARHGYIVGTRGLRSHVNTPTTSAVAAALHPVDHVEGVGLGETLAPFSLYQDQLLRRLGPAARLAATTISLPFPADTVDITPLGFSLADTPVPAAQVAPVWSSARPGVALVALPNGGVRATVPDSGVWPLTLTTTGGGLQNSQLLSLDASPSESTVIRQISPAADTYIEGGTPANTNYGSETRLRLKRATSASTTRHALLCFPVALPAGDIPLDANLVLTAQAPLATYSGWELGVHTPDSSTWQESTVTWNNSPAFGTPFYRYLPSPGLVDTIPLGARFLSAHTAGLPLDLGLTVLSQPDVSILSYHSREQSAASLRPRIDVTVIPGLARYEYWAAQFPHLPPSQSGPASQADADGVPNLVKMILGRPLGVPDSRPPLLYDPAGDRLSLVLAASLPPGLGLRIERSRDLINWSAMPLIPAHITTLPDGRRALALPAVRGAEGSTFWRLRATLAP